MKAGDLRDRVEELVWDCRIESEVPADVLRGVNEDGVGWVFGYQCEEYWKPNPTTKTVSFDVCPWWVDTKRLESRMNEIWEWCDEQAKEIKKLAQDAFSMLTDSDIPVERAIVPLCWQDWINGHNLFGVKCSFGDNNKIEVFSPDEFGAYRVMSLVT